MRTEPTARPHSVLSPQSFALVVSLLLHPFVVAPLTVLLLTDVQSSLLIVAVTMIPMLVLIAVNVRRGKWTNYDVSERTHRGGLYWPAVVLTAALAVVLWQEGAQPRLTRGVAASAVMLALSMIINRWLKLSLHMLFGAFCAVIIGWRFPAAEIPLALGLALLAWSRLTLKRHTWAEVFVGALMGCATGMWLVLT